MHVKLPLAELKANPFKRKERRGGLSLVNSHLSVMDYWRDRGVVGDIALKEIRVRYERIPKGFNGVEKTS